jgi:hypothetical protein
MDLMDQQSVRDPTLQKCEAHYLPCLFFLPAEKVVSSIQTLHIMNKCQPILVYGLRQDLFIIFGSFSHLKYFFIFVSLNILFFPNL